MAHDILKKIRKLNHTLLYHCLKLYTTLWNIWTYQQLCKKITQLVYNFTQIVYNFTQVVYFFTQQLVGSYVSQCCVNFLNSGLMVYPNTNHFDTTCICACLLGCFFAKFGIAIGGFSSEMKEPKLHKLGVFWANYGKKHPTWAKLGAFSFKNGILMGG